MIRYQTEVTEIGLNWAGSVVGLSGLGIAVSKVVSKVVLVCPFASCHRNLHNSLASSSLYSKILTTGISNPNTPTAAGFMPYTVARSSSTVNSPFNESIF